MRGTARTARHEAVSGPPRSPWSPRANRDDRSPTRHSRQRQLLQRRLDSSKATRRTRRGGDARLRSGDGRGSLPSSSSTGRAPRRGCGCLWSAGLNSTSASQPPSVRCVPGRCGSGVAIRGALRRSSRLAPARRYRREPGCGSCGLWCRRVGGCGQVEDRPGARVALVVAGQPLHGHRGPARQQELGRVPEVRVAMGRQPRLHRRHGLAEQLSVGRDPRGQLGVIAGTARLS